MRGNLTKLVLLAALVVLVLPFAGKDAAWAADNGGGVKRTSAAPPVAPPSVEVFSTTGTDPGEDPGGDPDDLGDGYGAMPTRDPVYSDMKAACGSVIEELLQLAYFLMTELQLLP